MEVKTIVLNLEAHASLFKRFVFNAKCCKIGAVWEGSCGEYGSGRTYCGIEERKELE